MLPRFSSSVRALTGLVVAALFATGCSSLPEAPEHSALATLGGGDVLLSPPDGATGLTATIGERKITVPDDCGGCGIVLTHGASDQVVTLSFEREGETTSESFRLVGQPNRPAPRTLTVLRGTPGDDLDVEIVDVDEGGDPDQRAEELRQEADVAAVQVDLPVDGALAPGRVAIAQGSPGRPDGLWHLRALDRSRLPSAGGYPVAVLDTGVDDQLELFGGMIQDGRNVTQPGTGHDYPAFHGTAMAGLIHSMVPLTPIIPYDLYGSDGTATTHDLVAGIIAAVDAGHRILSVSQTAQCRGSGADRRCPSLDALDVAIRHATSRGAVIIAAAGNNGSSCGDNSTTWPGAFADVISVGATNVGGGAWACSNTAHTPDLMAPGQDVLVSSVGGVTAVDSGTSIAAALVAGVVSSLWSARPDLTGDDIRRLLRLGGDALDIRTFMTSLPGPAQLDVSVRSTYPGELADKPDIDQLSTWLPNDYVSLSRDPESGDLVGTGALRVAVWKYGCQQGEGYVVQYAVPFTLRMTEFPRSLVLLTFDEDGYAEHLPHDCVGHAGGPDRYPTDKGERIADYFRSLSPIMLSINLDNPDQSTTVVGEGGSKWTFDVLDDEQRARMDEERAFETGQP